VKFQVFIAIHLSLISDQILNSLIIERISNFIN
jgi:hypothetical protein